ncbi:ABC transporter permease [Marinobacter hydrocarbonoclasticus]|nr:ABC transporter permease [Marinobacter nauticus]
MTTVLKRNPWVIWKDVVFALFIREIRTGFNDKFGLSWAVASPVIFIFVLSFARGLMDGGETHGMPTFAFMAYGMVIIQLFLTMLHACARSVQKNKALFAFRQVQPISSWLAVGLFEFLVKLAVLIVIWALMYFLQIEVQVDDGLMLLANILAVGIMAMSLGLMMTLLHCYIPETEKILGLATRPMFFISGVFFSLQDVPSEYWVFLNWNPVLHAIELSRQATHSNFGAAGVSAAYLWSCSLGSLALALCCYYVSWKQAVSR